MKKILIFLWFTILSGFAFGTTYYVAQAGSNSNNGGISSPWVTLKYATQHTVSGDLIFIKEGNITETEQCCLLPGVSISGTGISSSVSSTYNSQYIENGGAIQLFSNSQTNGNQSISYITLDGGLVSTIGIGIARRNNVRIHHVTVSNFIKRGITFYGESPTYNTGNAVDSCTIFNSSSRVSGGGGLICYSYQQGLLIHDNVLDQTDRAVGSNGNIVYGIPGHSKGLKFYNNICWKPATDGGSWNFHFESWNSDGGMEIYNNQFYGGDCAVDCAGGAKGTYAYSYYIHDNLFQRSTSAIPAISPDNTIGIEVEGQSVDGVIVDNNHFKLWAEAVGSTDGGYQDGPSTFSNIAIRKNLFEKCGYLNANKSRFPINFDIYLFTASSITNIDIYNNTVISDGVTLLDGIKILNSGTITGIDIRNNIFQGFANTGWLKCANTGTINGMNITNNIFWENDNNNNPSLSGNTVLNYNFSGNLKVNPLFVSSTDFNLRDNSPGVDAGYDVGIEYNGIAPDIGALESTVIGNNIPVIIPQNFSVAENSPNGTIVDTVIASPGDEGQTLTYSILSGNLNNVFSINVSTGIITVANSVYLNHESLASYFLVIKVLDNGSPEKSNQALITISVTDVNEAPVMLNYIFSLNENISNGSQVGIVSASDVDEGQVLSYSIISGNTNTTFSINSTTGVITIPNASLLNYSSLPVHTLVVRSTDNGLGSLYANSTITINIVPVAVGHAPIIANQSFNIKRNSSKGVVVGNVIASDPDLDILTYSIRSGNSGTAFVINSKTGKITVNSKCAISYPKIFYLIVRVTDNSISAMSMQATITINVIR